MSAIGFRSRHGFIVAAALAAATAGARAQMPQPLQTAAAALCDPRSLSGAPLAILWHPPGSDAHGIRQLNETTRVMLPPNVSSAVVQLWGAGGGGGAGSIETISEGGYGGGGGASGGYARAVLSIKGGAEYTVVAGRGGAAGLPAREAGAGGDGGATAVCDGASALAIAPGGAGGENGRANSRPGKGGNAAHVSTVVLAPQERRESRAGAFGGAPLFDVAGRGGAGGTRPGPSDEPTRGNGGRGGDGAITSQAPGDGARGGDGYAILSW